MRADWAAAGTDQSGPASYGPSAIRHAPHAAVLAALGMAGWLVTAAGGLLLPAARERNMGATAEKVFGHGRFASRGPALRSSLSLSGSSVASPPWWSTELLSDAGKGRGNEDAPSGGHRRTAFAGDALWM
ncbi:MAG: hypothetical protein IT208_13260 [Chthonomonadales bacterium]|nr:hypothetical protein [Chthonomonadales bacterium]